MIGIYEFAWFGFEFLVHVMWVLMMMMMMEEVVDCKGMSLVTCGKSTV